MLVLLVGMNNLKELYRKDDVMGRPYALGTGVSITRSLAEIYKLIDRFGVNNLATGKAAGRNFIMFDHDGQTYRFVIEPQDDEREEKRQWRCMVLYIKGALVLVEEGVKDLETVFLADRILPGGQSWGQYSLENNEIPKASSFKLLETQLEN